MSQNTINFKQWTTTQDGIDKLKLEAASISPDSLKEDDVLVKIYTVSLNYRDTEVINGTYGHHKSISQANDPLVPCSDMCGTIVQVGSSSSPWQTGTRVLSIFNQSHLSGQIKPSDMSSGLGLPLPGVLAEYRVFPASGLVKCPEYLSDEEACTLPIAAVTAWTSINWQSPLGKPLRDPETTVLVQGTGGVSIAGLLMAKAAGLKCIVTSSSDDKLSKAKELGADYTINYRTCPEWQDEVMKFSQDRGTDIILETGGAQTLRKSFACIAFGGCIACIGYLGGKEEGGGGMNVNVLALSRNVTLKGILNGPKDRFEEMVKFFEEKKVKMVVDRVFDFEEAKAAVKYLVGGGHFGKVVVKVVQA